MFEPTDKDEELIEKIRHPDYLTEEQFETFWAIAEDMCKTAGFTKESYKRSLDNWKLNYRRCENCTLFKKDGCDVIKGSLSKHRNIALCWIYGGNGCSNFTSD